jgi:hypothetical protein
LGTTPPLSSTSAALPIATPSIVATPMASTMPHYPTLSPCSSIVDMPVASVLAAFVEHILTAVASPPLRPPWTHQ